MYFRGCLASIDSERTTLRAFTRFICFSKKDCSPLLLPLFPPYSHFSLTKPYLIEGFEGFEEKFTNL